MSKNAWKFSFEILQFTKVSSVVNWITLYNMQTAQKSTLKLALVLVINMSITIIFFSYQNYYLTYNAYLNYMTFLTLKFNVQQRIFKNDQEISISPRPSFSHIFPFEIKYPYKTNKSSLSANRTMDQF